MIQLNLAVFFDGNGHVISNLWVYVSGSGNQYAGLFGRTNGATIQNLGIEAGGLYANSTNSSVYVGGLIGHGGSLVSPFTNSYVLVNGDIAGSVSNRNRIGLYLGGLVGRNAAISHNNYVIVNGDIAGSGGTSAFIGGIGGYNSNTHANVYIIMNGDITFATTNSNEIYAASIQGATVNILKNSYSIMNGGISASSSNNPEVVYLAGLVGFGSVFSNIYGYLNGDLVRNDTNIAKNVLGSNTEQASDTQQKCTDLGGTWSSGACSGGPFFGTIPTNTGIYDSISALNTKLTSSNKFNAATWNKTPAADTEANCIAFGGTWSSNTCSSHYPAWGDLPGVRGDYITASLQFDHDGDWDGSDTTLLCKYAPSIAADGTVTITKTGDCP